MTTTLPCIVYRCQRQEEMYLYLREDLKQDVLPEALRKRTGALIEVMRLPLTPQRKLARVDVTAVMQGLQTQGYFLQLPPQGHINGNLYWGD